MIVVQFLVALLQRAQFALQIGLIHLVRNSSSTSVRHILASQQNPSPEKHASQATLVMLVSVADLFDEARMALFPARL